MNIDELGIIVILVSSKYKGSLGWADTSMEAQKTKEPQE